MSKDKNLWVGKNIECIDSFFKGKGDFHKYPIPCTMNIIYTCVCVCIFFKQRKKWAADKSA